MLDRLLIDHALVSLCDPVIGNRAVYSRYCQQRGGGQRGDGMSRIWNRINRSIYPLCAFPGHRGGVWYRRIGTTAWQVSISVQILISNQSRRIWLEKDEILEKSFVRFKRVGEMMERYSGSSIFLCKRILIIITDSSAINLLTLLTRD